MKCNKCGYEADEKQFKIDTKILAWPEVDGGVGVAKVSPFWECSVCMTALPDPNMK